MFKQGISIRYKFLFLLTIIPIIALSAFILVAVNVFEQDKVAYVYTTTSSVTANMSTQIRNQLNNKLLQLRPAYEEYAKNGKFGVLSSTVFNNDLLIEEIVAFESDNHGEFQSKDFLEKVPGQATALLGGVKNYLKTIFTEFSTADRLTKIPYLDDRIFIFDLVKSESQKRSVVFMSVLRLSELLEQFQGESSYRLFLIDNKNRILSGNPQSLGQSLSMFLNLDEASAKVTYDSATGTKPLKSRDHTDYLLSYSKVGFGDLTIVSVVDKKKALSATEILLKKSLIFFGILISAIVIISLLTSKSITAALRELFFATQKVAEGDFNIRIASRSSDEVGALANNFNIMAVEVARLLDQTAEKARMENELQTAKTVQETLFPKASMKLADVSISGYYEPASECGGDWWHYSLVKNKIYFWIGDATGHGAAAALITSAAMSAAILIEHLELGPGMALEYLNRSIFEVSKGRLMMTFFMACYDVETHQLVYANASHEAPFLLKKSETALKKKDLIPLNEVTSPRIGQSLDSNYKEVRLQFEPGDRIFFYTDGVSDIHDPKNEPWGERRFIKSLLKHSLDAKIPLDFMTLFSKDFSEYRKSSPLIDDVTFFIIQRDT